MTNNEKYFESFEELWEFYFPRDAEEERIENMAPEEYGVYIVKKIFKDYKPFSQIVIKVAKPGE